MNSIAQHAFEEQEPAMDQASPSADLMSLDRPRKRRWPLWLALLVLAAGGGTGLYEYLGPASEQPVQYRTEVVRKQDVVKQVTATGTVSPLVKVNVGSQVSGRIQELLADYNSVVKKGQVIARLDSRLFKMEVASARANLTAARANLTKARTAAQVARAQYQRDKGLAAQKLVATAELETRLAAYRSAAAQVNSAQASVAQASAAVTKAGVNLAYTTVVAPIDGVVVSRSVDVGQTVAASLSAPTLFIIAGDMRKMEVHTSVAEADVGQLKAGMKVRFTVDAFPKNQFEGVVRQVRYEAETVQNVVTYDAVVSVDNRRLKLRPGMTANVSFVVAEQKDVLAVPSAALRFTPPGARAASTPPTGPAKAALKKRAARSGNKEGQKRQGAARLRSVWVLRQGAPVKVAVRTGISDGSVTVVQGDLKPGEQLVLGVKAAASQNQANSGEAKAGGAAGGRGARSRLF